MGWSPFKRKSASLPAEINGSMFYQVGVGPSYSLGKVNDINRINAFLQIPEVNAIFNLRARAHGNINIIIVDQNGRRVEQDDRIIQILNEPNYFQSKEEFFGQTNLFRDIFGDELIFLQQFGITPKQIFSLPPRS